MTLYIFVSFWDHTIAYKLAVELEKDDRLVFWNKVKQTTGIRSPFHLLWIKCLCFRQLLIISNGKKHSRVITTFHTITGLASPVILMPDAY